MTGPRQHCRGGGKADTTLGRICLFKFQLLLKCGAWEVRLGGQEAARKLSHLGSRQVSEGAQRPSQKKGGNMSFSSSGAGLTLHLPELLVWPPQLLCGGSQPFRHSCYKCLVLFAFSGQLALLSHFDSYSHFYSRK